ncbi:BRO family protein [Gilliamella apicola]|nr:BRO family protein [Gilliamella apicola]
MSNLSIFNFKNSPVRTTEINNQIWFLANDVCSILEYKNPRKAIADHCKSKGVTKRYTPTLCDVTKRDTTSKARKSQEMVYINEPNLFRLIIKSKQEKAVLFEEWVMEELLPTIRKTGSYSLTINAEQQQQIQQAVNERVYRTGERHQAVYSKFHQQFRIPRYQDLPASKFDEAIQWLGGVHARSGLSDDDWYDLAWLYKVADRMRSQIELVEPALRALDSSFVSAFHSMAIEYKRNLRSAKLIIERETAHIKAKNIIDKWNRVLAVIRHH